MLGKTDTRIKQFEATVVDYVIKESGHFVAVSQDNTFCQVLRSTLNKQLAIEEGCISIIMDEDQILKSLNNISRKARSVLLFMERELNHKNMIFLVKQIKNAYPAMKVVILTNEADRQQLTLLHEIGADNFITKPISMNTLIEKIAFTIKPQGKIGLVIEEGKKFLASGSYENALKVAHKVLELKPNSAAGLLMAGDAYKAMGKRPRALEAYTQASEHAQMYLEPLKKLAQFHREEGNVELELKYLERLDKLSPLNVERKVDMGGIHIELGNEEKADMLFNVAMKQANKAAAEMIEEVSVRIADVYSKSNPAKAESYYRQALKAKGNMLDIRDIKTFNQLGLSLRKQGRWQDAVIEYERALQIAPNDEALFYNMAMAYAEGKEYQKAFSNIGKAMTLNDGFYKNDPVISFNLGLIAAKNNDFKTARVYLEYTLNLKPDFAQAKKLLGTVTGK